MTQMDDPLTYRWLIDGEWYDSADPYFEWTWLDDYTGTITLEVIRWRFDTATDTADVTVVKCSTNNQFPPMDQQKSN